MADLYWLICQPAQNAVGGVIVHRGKFAEWLIMVVRAFSPEWMSDFITPLLEHGLSSYY